MDFAVNGGLGIRLIFLTALAVVSGCPVRAQTTQGAQEIDQTIVLTIGALHISRYALDKQFRQSLGQRSRSADNVDATRKWFELYLARQVMTAVAIKEGYAGRKEVADTVADMERHMLSQPSGPYYQTLYPTTAPPENELRRLYEASAIVPDVVVVRALAQSFARCETQSWKLAANDERLRWIRDMAGAPDVTFHEGPLPWPFEPFPELSGSMAPPVAETWVVVRDRRFVTMAYVKKIEQRVLPPFQTTARVFADVVRVYDRRAIERQHRKDALTASQLAVDFDRCATLARHIREAPIASVEIPDAVVLPIAAEGLASYVAGGNSVRITVSRWQTYFNHLFIRRIPRSALEVEASVTDLVMSDLDCRQAHSLGIDNTPQFTEDRANFARAQSLALFERERLCPTLTVSEAEIASYYAENRQQFTQNVGAKGVLFTFDSGLHAKAWLSGQRQVSDQEASPPPGLVSKVQCEVTVDRPLSGFEDLSPLILYAGELQAFGPVPTHNGEAVFVKQSTQRGVIPLATASQHIRDIILQQKLTKAEQDLAKVWAADFEVDDRIPYHEYGLDGPVLRPWGAVPSLPTTLESPRT